MRVLVVQLSHVTSQEVGYDAQCEFVPVVPSSRVVEDCQGVMVVRLL